MRPGGPPLSDERWVESNLGAGELELWRQMNNPDKRHAVGVAKLVVAELESRATRPVIAAALLHDVGKIRSGYRTPARVLATLVWAVVPNAKVDEWLSCSRPWRRLAEYRAHPQIGEAMLVQAEADSLTSMWAGDHHRPNRSWRIDHELGEVLKSCDDD